MATRPGPRAPEGYPSTYSPPIESRDPFASAGAVPPRRYYDNDSEDFGRGRDTYASDSSQGPHDGERFYDNSGYDPYSEWSRRLSTFVL